MRHFLTLWPPPRAERAEVPPDIGPLRSSLFRHRNTSSLGRISDRQPHPTGGRRGSKTGPVMGTQRTSGGLRRELLAVLGISTIGQYVIAENWGQTTCNIGVTTTNVAGPFTITESRAYHARCVMAPRTGCHEGLSTGCSAGYSRSTAISANRRIASGKAICRFHANSASKRSSVADSSSQIRQRKRGRRHSF